MYKMKRYPVAVLRDRLSEALDAAYQGVPVVIERKGVQYRLTRAAAAQKRSRPGPAMFEILDPAVLSGQWTWEWAPEGMTFVGAAPKPAPKPTKTRK